MLSIGDLSRRTGVKIPTIRFYEQKGLMPEPERTPGNQRRYDRAAQDRLDFIRHARDLGLPLDDVSALISLEGARGTALDRAHAIAKKQRLALRHRIRQLQNLEKQLAHIESSCDGSHDTACTVLSRISHAD